MEKNYGGASHMILVTSGPTINKVQPQVNLLSLLNLFFDSLNHTFVLDFLSNTVRC